MATAFPDFVRLDGDAVTLVIDTTAGVPVVLYWGPLLPALDPAGLALLGGRAEANASPRVAAPLALTPQAGQGWPGRPGLAAHRDGRGWASYALLDGVEASPDRAVFTSVDPANGLALVHDLRLDSDVLVATTTLTNRGDLPLTVDHLAAPVLPVPGLADRIIGFEGRWAGEFQTVEMPRHIGTWLRENRRGRTSHDAFPGVILAEAGANESRGLAWGWHLGWSGNHRLAVDTLSDGRGLVMMEELLLPGEVRLATGESLGSPTLYAAASAAGLSGLSQAFHRHLRARPEHARLRAKPRPVHYNSWEAVYFDHDPAVLADLASRAAAVGAERFVLDDGWFKGRRSDRAGLGDWTVDPAVWPDGLGPIIAHVRDLGMEFGLWVEPEMVNPDSDLYRAHPDWVLATPPAPQLDFRHQLVLDFGRADVREHLFGAVDALLRDHPIAYLKWDMNRDISHPGGADGRAGARAHVLGLYDVLDRLRATHPGVEIESCASGGGRADYAILARTDRIWTSDSNDSIDRLGIQRGFSHFFPAELMGSHVGPRRCHISGRVLPMALRVATALFGHMGMEMDLREMDAEETAILTAGVALHKQHRALIHGGGLVRLDTAAGVNAFAIVAADRGEALLSYTMVEEQRGYFPVPLRFAGLDAAADYRVTLAWPTGLRAESPLFDALRDGAVLSGAALMQAGFQPPRLHPATSFILHLQRL
ncbi:alpha-galactosidase [Sandarakinorhabdus sp. DWP1-3-1]|uniref:alpha-galactosidase n=1 Tax=Sandarakinorhabdus sp. DWP1-3-1 TaxID=2804627 RepID=UPI003CF87E4C